MKKRPTSLTGCPPHLIEGFVNAKYRDGVTRKQLLKMRHVEQVAFVNGGIKIVMAGVPPSFDRAMTELSEGKIVDMPPPSR